MTSDHDVRALLDTLADDAPRPDEAIEAARLLPRIRRRRRLQAAAPICAALAVAGLGAALFSATPWNDDTPAGDARDAGRTGATASRPDDAGGPLGRCGEPVTTPRTASDLRLALRMPRDVAAGRPVAATLTLTNTGPARVRGFTVTAPQVVLVAGGVLVAAPQGTRDVALQVDLGPGATMDLPVTVPLQRCDANQAPPQADKMPVAPPPVKALAAGTYQAYAVVGVQPTGAGGPAGAIIEAHGGPWSVQVR